MKSIKKLALTILVTGTVFSSTFTSLAGEWKQDEYGTWWDDGDGWHFINDPYESHEGEKILFYIDDNNDGVAEQYCFDHNGYLLTNTFYEYEGMGITTQINEKGQNMLTTDTPYTITIEYPSTYIISSSLQDKYTDLLGKDINYIANILGLPTNVYMSSDNSITREYSNGVQVCFKYGKAIIIRDLTANGIYRRPLRGDNEVEITLNE